MRQAKRFRPAGLEPLELARARRRDWMEAVIEAWCVGCRRYVTPAARGGRLRRKPPRLPLRGLSLPRRPRGPVVPRAAEPAGPPAAGRRGGSRGPRPMLRGGRPGRAGGLEAFGFLGDFKIGLGVSKKTFKRMVERAKASAESNDDD